MIVKNIKSNDASKLEFEKVLIPDVDREVHIDKKTFTIFSDGKIKKQKNKVKNKINISK